MSVWARQRILGGGAMNEERLGTKRMRDNLGKIWRRERRRVSSKGRDRRMQEFFSDGNQGGWVGGWWYSGLHAPGPPAKFIMDRHEKARLNYLLVEENMRLTSLWNMIGLTSDLYSLFNFHSSWAYWECSYSIRFGLVWLMTWIFYTGRWPGCARAAF